MSGHPGAGRPASVLSGGPGSLRADKLLKFDLYIATKARWFSIVRSLSFRRGRARAAARKQSPAGLHSEPQRSQFLGYMERELPELLRDEHIPVAAKANMVYTTSKVIVEEIFENPTYGENIKRSEQLVSQTVVPDQGARLVPQPGEALRRRLQALFALGERLHLLTLGLAQEVGVDDPEELTALGIGAMLHDVGKTRIDPRILRKRSALSHAEFELMKRHIEYGVEIVKQMPDIPKAAYIPVIQHNEREDGTGYPRGLSGDQIHLFGKITAIADVFDAMTTNRVFQKASTAFDAFTDMLKMPLDQKLLHRFIQLLGPEKVG